MLTSHLRSGFGCCIAIANNPLVLAYLGLQMLLVAAPLALILICAKFVVRGTWSALAAAFVHAGVPEIGRRSAPRS